MRIKSPNRRVLLLIAIASLIPFHKLLAQSTEPPCKVDLPSLTGTYTGECKNGFAQGKGEAKGIDRYVGLFKSGLPNGKGIMYYGDTAYHSGNFQDGIKEGKGETHYTKAGEPEKIVEGYWSGDEFKGKTYKTYHFTGASLFDMFEISPSEQSGKTLTIEISTTSGSPDGTKPTYTSGGNVITIDELIPIDGNIVITRNSNVTPNKSVVNYEISSFPIRLQITLSTGRIFELELYKAAAWIIKLYNNS